MNKSQLIDALAAEAKMTKIDARKVLDALIKVTGTTLKAGDGINLVGFGSFSVVAKPARTGRNPRTGATIKVAAKKAVKFRAGTQLNKSVN